VIASKDDGKRNSSRCVNVSQFSEYFLYRDKLRYHQQSVAKLNVRRGVLIAQLMEFTSSVFWLDIKILRHTRTTSFRKQCWSDDNYWTARTRIGSGWWGRWQLPTRPSANDHLNGKHLSWWMSFSYILLKFLWFFPHYHDAIKNSRNDDWTWGVMTKAK